MHVPEYGGRSLTCQQLKGSDRFQQGLVWGLNDACTVYAKASNYENRVHNIHLALVSMRNARSCQCSSLAASIKLPFGAVYGFVIEL